MFKRYGDVNGLLETMSFNDVVPFIGQLIDQVTDERLYDVWLSNPLQEDNFKDFKRKALRESVKQQKRNTKNIEKEAKETEQKIYEFLRGEVKNGG